MMMENECNRCYKVIPTDERFAILSLGAPQDGPEGQFEVILCADCAAGVLLYVIDEAPLVLED